MPVARIKEIIRKLLSAIFSLEIIIIFISYVAMYIYNQIYNNKYTNFNEINKKTNDMWIYNNGDEKKEESLKISMWVAVIMIIALLLGIVIPCIIQCYTLCRLYRRIQNNEPADHFQDRFHWNGQAIVHPQNL